MLQPCPRAAIAQSKSCAPFCPECVLREKARLPLTLGLPLGRGREADSQPGQPMSIRPARIILPSTSTMPNGSSASRFIRNCSLIRHARQSRPVGYLLYNGNYTAGKRSHYQSSASFSIMGENTNGEQVAVPADASRGAVEPSDPSGPRMLKILMLHGKPAIPRCS